VAVAAVIGALITYATLTLGFAPNTSIVATLLGFGATAVMRVRGRSALVAIQAAGVAAGQTAFMAIALAAIGVLRERGALEVNLRPGSLVVFAWLTCAGVLGVFVALPLRRYYIEQEDLPFAAGLAAAEAIVALEPTPTGASGSATWRRAGASLVAAAVATFARIPLSPLAVGSGMLIGARTATSIGAGAALAVLLPTKEAITIAVALLVAGGVTRTALRASSLTRGWRAVRPPWLVLAGGVVGLVAIDRLALATPIGATLVAIMLAAPLVLVGTRVLGETNWAPVVALAAVSQLVLAVVVPGHTAVNVIASAVAAAIVNAAQHTMQSFRVAACAGTPPRDVAVAHLVGVAVGAAMLALAFPLLVARSGSGVLASPLSVAWANIAVAVTHRVDAIHVAPAALAAAIGVVLALAESRWHRVPSPMALGIGALMPWRFALAVALGGAIELTSKSRNRVSVAAGLVAGEAIAGTLATIV
jgi:uncharacterized oligopeptide transporter (OPT) family protein